MGGYIFLNIDVDYILKNGKTKLPGSFRRAKEVYESNKLVYCFLLNPPVKSFIVFTDSSTSTQDGVIKYYNFTANIGAAKIIVSVSNDDTVEISDE